MCVCVCGGGDGFVFVTSSRLAWAHQDDKMRPTTLKGLTAGKSCFCPTSRGEQGKKTTLYEGFCNGFIDIY